MKVGFTGRVARSAAEHPWRTITAWALIFVAGGVLAGSVNDYVTFESTNYVTTDSDSGYSLQDEYRPNPNGTVYTESAVVASDVETFSDGEFQATVAQVVTALSGIEGVNDIVAPALGTPAVSQSGHAAIVSFTTIHDEDVSRKVLETLAVIDTPQVRALPAGEGTFAIAFSDLAESELARSESFGIIAALVILVVVFGALVAAGLPLLVAIVSIATTTGAISLLGRMTDVYDGALTLAGMLGLALGIDYSLVAIQRFREELAKGHTVLDAITITGSTANRAILLSGATVFVSLAGMMLVPTMTTFGVAIGVGLVAITSVAAAITLLPAVLRLLGHRVNKGRIPTAHPGAEPKAWTRVARAVIRRPALSAVAGIAVLLVLAAPAASMRLANAGPDAMPESFVIRQSNLILNEEFGYGQSTTFVAIDNAGGAHAQVNALAAAIEAYPAYEDTSVTWVGDVAFIDTHDAFGSDDTRADAALERLRTETIPDALAGTGASGHVAGDHAKQHDEITLFRDGAWKVVAAVLGASFLILLVMFRSIVIPLKAIVLNLLGVGAAFGAMVAAYQFGWGTFLGLPQVAGISPYMPLFIFALVFGLSMDYHVFLLSRIKERHDATRDNERSIVEGLARTGPLITGAAVIMIFVFGGFAGADVPELSQWGFGLAAAVLIDATIIRILLVPAAMAWLGKANWYLPRWLEWLPKTTIKAPFPAPEMNTDRGERKPALV